MGADNSERCWLREAAVVARRVNTGWWLGRFNLLLSLALIVFAVVVLTTRTWLPYWFQSFVPFAILIGLVAASAIFAWFWSRGRFIGKEEALARLDDRLNLNNQLSSANREVCQWPEHFALNGDDIGLKWRWEVAILPGVLAFLLVLAAWFVPIIELKGTEETLTHEPNAWGQIEEWLATLQEEQLTDPSSIEEIEGKIAELRDQPEKDWFEHASLEASDTLKEEVGRDIQDLARNLGIIERDLDALKTFSTQLSDAGKEMLLQEMEDAMKNLAMNSMGLNSDLAKQLSQVDPSQISEELMNSLNSEQMQELQNQLAEKLESLGNMNGLPPMAEGGWQLNSSDLLPGQGGNSSGQADAPLFYGEEDDLRTNNVEKITNKDLSRASLGDLLSVGETQHEEDERVSGSQAGGRVFSNGRGGEAVWRESLIPEEQALLKRYFKKEN